MSDKPFDGFDLKDVVFNSKSNSTFSTSAKPPEFDLKALQEAIKSMEGVRKPITELRVIESVFVEQGAPMLLCHPDDYEFIKSL